MSSPSDSIAFAGDPAAAAIHARYLADDESVINALLTRLCLEPAARQHAVRIAEELVLAVRSRQLSRGGLDAFMREYDLSSQEGVVLMCMAEALLRIPDPATADQLIRGKLAEGDWERHLGHSPSLLVNASTWGLVLTGRLVAFDAPAPQGITGVLQRLIARGGEPLIRHAIEGAMRLLADQFVLAQTIEDAIDRRRQPEFAPYRFSFDMLGEAAMTQDDADRYFGAYEHAIRVVAGAGTGTAEVADSISVKLSALHPRFEIFQRERVLRELPSRLLDLARMCRDRGIDLTIDAEETERLELTLDIFSRVFADASLRDWNGLGLAVQAYQKRAVPVIEWLAARAQAQRKRIPLRLVKGAYWDSEIKRAQQQGLPGYPVFTNKAATDVSYLSCACALLNRSDAFAAQFATHNAHTVAAILQIAGADRKVEFQRLHGMGEELYAEAIKALNINCRVYAPIGSHRDLLPYLVRRLLENGANTSFVNRVANEAVPIAIVTADPVTQASAPSRIPLPAHLYGDERRNSQGINLTDTCTLRALLVDVQEVLKREWHAQPRIDGQHVAASARPVVNPADRMHIVGHVMEASDTMAADALATASRAFPAWNATPVDERAQCLERAADLFEAHRTELIALCVAEAGKTVTDAVAEVREAVDYCRYYAAQARRLMSTPRDLTGVTGESNELALAGRGPFVCISPWNFPLAIFTGQIAAALATGNTVVAKPAEQTPLVAARAIELLLDAGIPGDVLGSVPGPGDTIGAQLCRDPRTAGVVFTGSTETAWAINRLLAGRDAPIAPLIAETGGQNVMIVDSSALIEQVVRDAVRSAFNSTGQRCSALRVLYLQHEIADMAIAMLRGAMAQLQVGDPASPATDVGPVIDLESRERLNAHIARMEREAVCIARTPLPPGCAGGTFIAPHAFELDSIRQLDREVFGPVLHVIRYQAEALEAVIADINRTGYGLTLGIHSRIDATIDFIAQRVRAGNIYVNRDMIGAVVGVQPFGGMGLSGTGPKAGGPEYLHRFVTEKTLTVNTAAVGGNPALLGLS